MFDYKYSSYPGNEAKSPECGRFLTIFRRFSSCMFWHKPLTYDNDFLLNFIATDVLSCAIRDFFMTVTIRPKSVQSRPEFRKILHNLSSGLALIKYRFQFTHQKDLKFSLDLDIDDMTSPSRFLR